MSIRITLLSSLLVFIILEHSFSIAYPFKDLVLQPQDEDLFQNDDFADSWGDLGQRVMSKKGCEGFPCMYTHLSAKAGRASLYRKLARLIDDCVANPSCNPGRRKRSISAALQVLSSNNKD